MTTAAKPAVLTTAPSAALAVPYSMIPKKPVHWFWKGFIPFRHVTLLIGPGGTSKGITTVDLGARMTRHDLAPGETEYDDLYDGPRDIILIAPEDDPNETVAGRLEAAGAVPDRVHNLTVFPDGQRFSVPTDIAAITLAIKEIEFDLDENGERTIPRIAEDGQPHKVGMVILDPLLALSETEMTRRGQARPVMEALEDQARLNDVVLILTHHTNADGRAAGSRGIVETVRNQLSLSRLPGKAGEDSPVRLCTVTKTNIGITGKVERYVLAGTIEEPHVMWTCEAPPADVSRGYDVEPAAVPAAAGDQDVAEDDDAGQKPVKGHCTHPWRMGASLCGNCPRKDESPSSPAPKHAVITPGQVPPAERYRALTRVLDPAAGTYGPPRVLKDCRSPAEAASVCNAHAGMADLAWKPVPAVPGMLGAAEATVKGQTVAYSVLDRVAALAGSNGSKPAAAA